MSAEIKLLSNEDVLKLIQESVESLVRSETIDGPIELNVDTVLMGADAVMNSIGFVTFVTDVEDRILEKTGTEYYLVLNEISEFSIDTPNLTVDVLAQYIVQLTNR